jgi:hypothetical protein
MDLQWPLDHQQVYLWRESYSSERQNRDISGLTGFFRNLEFFGFFGFAFFTSYLSLSFFCVSEYGFLSFFHSVRSSGRYEGICVGFLELDKDVSDPRNIFIKNSVNISVDWTRIRERRPWSKKFEEIWRKKMCSGHFGWRMELEDGRYW